MVGYKLIVESKKPEVGYNWFINNPSGSIVAAGDRRYCTIRNLQGSLRKIYFAIQTNKWKWEKTSNVFCDLYYLKARNSVKILTGRHHPDNPKDFPELFKEIFTVDLIENLIVIDQNFNLR